MDAIETQLIRNAGQRVVVPDQAGLNFLNGDDIIRLESVKDYTIIYLQDGSEVVSSQALKRFDQRLSLLGFLKVHQNHLVNTKHIFRYLRQDGIIILSDGSKVDVSKRKPTLLSRLTSHFLYL